MDKIPFEDGTKISDAKVTIDGQDYTVAPAVYEGTTPFSAFNFNKMQSNIETAINEATENAKIAERLKTPRAINLIGDVTGSANFDGSGDISISTTVPKIKKITQSAINMSGTSKTITLNYPTGFNPSSVVLGCGILDMENTTNPAYTYGDTDVKGNTLKCSVNLTQNNIQVKITRSLSYETYLDLKLVLMNI